MSSKLAQSLFPGTLLFPIFNSGDPIFQALILFWSGESEIRMTHTHKKKVSTPSPRSFTGIFQRLMAVW